MNRALPLFFFALACIGSSLAATAAVKSAKTVLIIVHVPLQMNDGSKTPAAVLAAYREAFEKVGEAEDHPSVGSWVEGQRLEFEPDDLVSIRTTPREAVVFLRPFLATMRDRLKQEATLGEVVGNAPGLAAESRIRMDVVFPLTCWCSARELAVHKIFAAAGGASQYDDLDGTHVYSAVPESLESRVRKSLSQANLKYTETGELFVLVSASDR